jgi:hypothetical protein
MKHTRRQALSRLGTTVLVGTTPLWLSACSLNGPLLGQWDTSSREEKEAFRKRQEEVRSICRDHKVSQIYTGGTALDEQLNYKYRGCIYASELIVDGFGTPKGGIVIRDEINPHPFYAAAGVSPGGKQISARNISRFPKTLRVTWYDDNDPKLGGTGEINNPYKGGKILGDYTVKVAERISDDILDAMRAGVRGGMRFKLRVADDGLWVGWDLDLGVKYASLIRDERYKFVGGDFREADIHNGKVLQKGWYIDKKTGRKIDTDV